ncbi:hypothetical protein HYC85_024680 [Camellia sinensis]|uniref:Trichome birefringence-like N-terminal domain-containing protein n=1 Tax=Camellia sinensis TaxID=4442 RepID=A0A7J7GCQ9_CAMSI|nr:hypothetical protein HYC85_024680 [Camellia sinensis]
MAKPPPPPPPPTPTTEKPSLKNGSTSSSLSSLIRRSIAFPYGFGFAFAFLAFSIFSLLNNYYDSAISFNNRSHFSTVFSHFFFFPSSPQLPITRSNNNPPREDDIKGFQEEKTVMNNDGFLSNKQVKQQTKEEWLDSIDHCNLYNGSWVRDDDSYPLYEAGSCPHIDEQFNCFLNGRPDNKFENFRWQPNGCNIPRQDYNCSVEFFRSSFLVQEWEMAYTNGLKRATLRLDVMERSSDRYKSANVLIFNTGHWWTRGRTARGGISESNDDMGKVD